ncbi:phosphoglycerate mutase-like protein [Testicularia cyperi]|uniref:Phosphoglycerate mutase-like protein n=1 Tax=Testicularia cyperi TaxID=1882483 RepID=A0A317XRI6_9BASI|nr:phosphoglycerate mutase-like protein [Testicularia cyperi]
MAAGASKGRHSDDDDVEAEALILHRMSTDEHGRQRIQSIGSGVSGNDLQARVTDAYDDLDENYDLEDDGGKRAEKLPARGTLEGSNSSTLIDKTGRPKWFRGLLQGELPLPGFSGRGAGVSATTAQKKRRQRVRCVRLFAIVGGFALVVGAFVFAFGPQVGTNPKKWYEYMGDKWYGATGSGSGSGGIVGGMPFEFNKPVGYPGFYTTGAAPDFAEHMTQTAPAPTKTIGSSPIQTTIPGFQDSSFNPFEHMGPLTPYVSSSGWGVDDATYAGTPRSSSGGSCTLRQAHMLHRHGARYPTAGGPPDVLRDFLRDHPTLRYTGRLEFLNQYKFGVGEELLTPVGRAQLYDSGAKAALLYGKLVADDAAEPDINGQSKTLFARAGSQQRIVDSGLAWLNGFFGAEWANSTSFEIQIENNGFNTTTAPEFACPSWSRPGNAPGGRLADQWADNYLQDAVLRLGPDFGGATLTPRLLFGMQQMCSYDTVAFGVSDFCGLFTKQEWLDYEYAWDLRFMNTNGPTSPLGQAYGLGWVNELVSRLERKPWDASTQTSENATLNSNPLTFPLDRRFYVDFTHDSTITSVIATLSFPQFAETLLPENADKASRNFVTSKLVPFAARLVVEVWDCNNDKNSNSSDDDSWLRIKLNDAVVPLDQFPQCDKRKDGFCKLANFLAAQARRNDNKWWDRCRI